MSPTGLLSFLTTAWQVGGLRAPVLLLRYLRLTLLNRTSRSRAIALVPERRDEAPTPRSSRGPGVADIIVPIYGNLEQTRDLLTNLANDGDLPGRVILIDDASPDERMLPMLRAVCAKHPDWQLLENERNLGFVGSCNRGIAATRQDVVVLNTDVEMPPGAAHRVVAALQAAPDIATATPFSNSAYGVGFPQLNYPNPRPFGATTAEIDSCFAGLPPLAAIDLPRGVGFCMAMSRTAIERVGGFSAEFGRGYGEDSGFSLEAARLGMRNVVAANAYVFHIGGQSFSGSWQARSRRGTLQVLAQYPEYPRLVEDYLSSGLARAACFVALLRLAEKKSGHPVAICRDDAADDGSKASSVDGGEARLLVRKSGTSVAAEIEFGGEKYFFRFSDWECLERALALHQAK